MPDWIRYLMIFAISYVIVRVLLGRRRLRPGIMHDRNALAKKFETTPDDIIVIKPPAEN